MIKRLLLIQTLFIFCFASIHAQSSLEGKVVEDNGDAVIFGDVALYKDGVLVTGTQTDFDGNYSINNIDPGSYEVHASYVGLQTNIKTGVVITGGKLTRLDFTLSKGINLETVVITEYKKPLIEQDNTTSGGALTSDEIKNLPTKNINALASTTAGLASTDGGAINVRGSRSSGTDYYVDGIRVSGNLIPQSEIEQLTVLIGGIPASYGDVTGGVISLTTKGPSGKFSGGFELETSEFLDAYGYNLLTANVSGPIVKNKQGNSIIGFRLSGQYTDVADGGPSAIGVYRAKESTILELEENPAIFFPNGQHVNGVEFVDLERNGGDLQLLDARPNNANTQLNLNGRLDFRIKDIDLSMSGSYITGENIFTPGGTYRWSAFNWLRNPTQLSDTYRGTVRIKHRLGGFSAGNEEGKKVSAIRNVSYAITAGFQRRTLSAEDKIHKDNMFNYGYVGEFIVTPEPSFEVDAATGLPVHTEYQDVFQSYTPDHSINPVWTKINELSIANSDFERTNILFFDAYNGTLGSGYTNSWGLYQNVGSVYNSMSKSEGDRYTIDVKTNFQFAPGGSEKGKHNIEVGFLYEQRLSRAWSIAPRGLYTVARARANSALQGVDTTRLIGQDTFLGQLVDIYESFVTSDAERTGFYSNIRESLGLQINDRVNVDAIKPGDMQLSWFRPDELASEDDLLGFDYYGYDYLGNKLSGNFTFDDFFTRDSEGNPSFTVAPFQPNYLAAYIQDKFSFKDIIFRLGVRMERYDANTKVLSDPYSLYPIMDASTFYNTVASDRTRPSGVEDSYKVYVESSTNDRVVAYRDGDQWYDLQGSPVNEGLLIFGEGSVITPYYNEVRGEAVRISDANFDPARSFEDYEPEINLAPRLSFSFPISESSNFYANYDVLYQRPTAGVLQTALDYFYFEERAASRAVNNNPNLKPVQTTNYEVGFNQKISASSALKIAFYYKEERDRIQRRTLNFVASPILSYTTYDNIDFATIKGFSFTYDLRRTGNINLLANYTLQFADGTGSDANSQAGLTSRGRNVRTLSPLSFDERHRFNLTMDYRYGSGKQYNGPRIFGADIFANAGANIQAIAVSGRPYTKRLIPARFGGSGFAGGINEARLPWNFTVNMKLDKNFVIQPSKEGKRPYSFNVYLRVQNLFDTQNVLGVYSASGSPDDDGYLASSQGISTIGTVEETRKFVDADLNEFLAQYEAALLAPGFYSLPRRIYLGAYFNF
jgi:outer membrane receptor protein involved in Fe transport